MKHFLKLSCAALTLAVAAPASAEDLTVYDLPSKYMNWAGLVEAYEAKTGIRPTLDLKNGSSTALAAIKLEAANPIANAAYWSLDIASEAKAAGLLAPLDLARIDEIPADLKDPENYWWGVATANIVIGVNTDVLDRRGLPVPTSWADLLDPKYKGLACSMDPTWSGTASVFMYSMNAVLGGAPDDFTTGFTYLKAFKENGHSYRTEIVAPRLAQGECAITVDAEGNILIEKANGAPVDVVIPSEGVAAVPLGMGLVKGAPEQDKAVDFLNWVLSDEAQAIIAQSYFRPVIASAISADMAAQFPVITRQVPVDIPHAAAHVGNLKRAFTEAVLQDGDVKAALAAIGLAGS
jgi:putative spermidine/putrescine transport system substrate-binding protein